MIDLALGLGASALGSIIGFLAVERWEARRAARDLRSGRVPAARRGRHDWVTGNAEPRPGVLTFHPAWLPASETYRVDRVEELGAGPYWRGATRLVRLHGPGPAVEFAVPGSVAERFVSMLTLPAAAGPPEQAAGPGENRTRGRASA